jgi:predicted acetyltransferase
LVWPSRECLPSYVEALQRGWSADNLRGHAAAQEELRRIAADPKAFLASRIDRDARGGDVVLPDGSRAPRIPGYFRWMWDGEFCGTINFRWQPGTEALPPYCLGHIGYAVVPWKQRRGHATRALGAILKDARAEGLRYVELTTVVENVASQHVIERNGGVRVEEFTALPSLGGRRHYRYRIALIDAR